MASLSGGLTTTSSSKLSVWFNAPPLSGQSKMSWSTPGMTITKWNLFSISILQDCIKDERDESNRRTDATTSGEDVDIIYRAKKYKVRCDN